MLIIITALISCNRENTIISSPSGAEIYINGKQIGITPLKKQLPKGDYNIELIKKGYLPVKTELSIEDDLKYSFALELTPISKAKKLWVASTSGLNLREKPSTVSKIISLLPAKRMVYLIKKLYGNYYRTATRSGTWLHVIDSKSLLPGYVVDTWIHTSKISGKLTNKYNADHLKKEIKDFGKGELRRFSFMKNMTMVVLDRHPNSKPENRVRDVHYCYYNYIIETKRDDENYEIYMSCNPLFSEKSPLFFNQFKGLPLIGIAQFGRYTPLIQINLKIIPKNRTKAKCLAFEFNKEKFYSCHDHDAPPAHQF